MPGLGRSRRDLGVIGILGGIPMKTKIPGGSPGGIYGGIFFVTESRRENTRVSKIPAGSRGNRDSWRDPGEGKDSQWESRRDLWRDFFPDGIPAGKYLGWKDPGGISALIGILGGIPPRSRWLFYKGKPFPRKLCSRLPLGSNQKSKQLCESFQLVPSTMNESYNFRRGTVIL